MVDLAVTIEPAPGALLGEHYVRINHRTVATARMDSSGLWTVLFHAHPLEVGVLTVAELTAVRDALEHREKRNPDAVSCPGCGRADPEQRLWCDHCNEPYCDACYRGPGAPCRSCGFALTPF